MAERILILSDLHLGRPGPERGPASLAPLWSDVDRVVLNGDTAEVHHPDHWSTAARSVLALMDRCDADEVELTVLSGNHDPYISDLRHLRLAGGSVLVTHGDAMHPAVAPWSPAAGRMRAAHREAVAAMPTEVRDRLTARLAASQHAAFAEWRDDAAIAREARRSTIVQMLLRPWSVFQVMHYWAIFPRRAAEFAAAHDPDAQWVVTGHTHWPGVWRTGDRTIINTGSFSTPCRPRAVVVDGPALRFHELVFRAGTWRLGRIARSWDLPQPADDATEAPPTETPAGQPPASTSTSTSTSTSASDRAHHGTGAPTAPEASGVTATPTSTPTSTPSS
ncbi:MAG: metallophosphoesterase [Phycisphaerales bacterium]